MEGKQPTTFRTTSEKVVSPTGTPHPGLAGTPAKTRAIFSQDHPYFPKDCNHCAFYKPNIKSRLRSLFKAQTKDCYHCPYIDGCIYKNKEWITYTDYGERLQIHINADTSEIIQNERAAKSLLNSFPDMIIKIREHVIISGVKNPEYEINGLIGDRKGIEKVKGIKSAFNKAIRQGCQVVVIDLDMNMGIKPLSETQIAKYIDWRRDDFESGKIKECYVIYRGKAIMIDKSFTNKDKIADELEKLKQ